MKYRALAAGAALALILSGTVLGHFVTPTCGAVTFNDTNAGWTAVVQPGDLTFGPFTDGDNGPYKIAAGSYTYTFLDTQGAAQETGEFTVQPCAMPSPSHAPKPTPKPTPPVTATLAERGVIQGDNAWAVMLVYLGSCVSLFMVGFRFIRRIWR